MSENRRPFCIMTTKGRAVGESILDGYSLKATDSKAVAIDRFHASYSEHGVVKPPYDPVQLLNLVEANTYHARCIDVKARDTAGLGVEIAGIGDNPPEALQAILQDALDNMTTPITETLFRAETDVESIGWGAIEIIRENDDYESPVVDLVHIPAHTLRRHSDGLRILQIVGTSRVWFRIFDPDQSEVVDAKNGQVHGEGEAVPEERRAHELMWWRAYSARTSLYGVPRWLPAVGVIAADYSRREYNRTFFENYGIPSYAVFITGNFDPGPEDANGQTPLEAEIEKHFAQIAKNPHSTLILSIPSFGGDGEVNVEFKPLAVDVKEASFRLFRADNRDEIIVAHGVPPYRIGVMTAGQLAGNIAEAAAKIYKTSVIEPRQGLIEQWLRRVFTSSYQAEHSWRVVLADIDTDDEKADMELLRGLFDMGAITPAEVRRQFAGRFTLNEADESDLAMHRHYVGGQAIEGGDYAEEFAVRALKAARVRAAEGEA